MNKYLLLVLISISLKISAQTPDEALRTAWFTPNGTARNMAIGGVMGSLGGDLSAAHVNPAGLGFYKTKEFIFSPAFLFNNNQLNYRGKDSSSQKNAFHYGTSGLVFGKSNTNNYSKWNSSAFSFSVSQLASYNNRIQFKGFNNTSSFSEQYLEELTRDRADTNAALSNYIFGSSLAYRTYLIDTLNNASGALIGYQSLVPISTGVNQIYDANTTGGYHEVAMGFAGNYNDKWYVGGSFTIPIVTQRRETTYRESDATNNPNNNFSFFEYKESFNSTGVGVGLKLGAIYKPANYWRLGFAFHTPQVISFKDRIRSEMTTNTESYAGNISENSNALNSNNEGIREYTLTTPWRAIASASYVFREVSNTKKQRAFISADIEFVDYSAARFSKNDEEGFSIGGYYNQLNTATKNYYRGNFNFKLGGELKFDPIMFRAGVSYFGSPYKNEDLKANRFVASLGLGYRNNGMFIDLAVARTFVNDVQFAYRLVDKANTFATQTGNIQNVVLTVGFKF